MRTIQRIQQYQLWNRSNALALSILILCGLLCWGLSLRQNGNLLTPDGLKQTIQNLGVLGPIAYIGLLALSVVISPIPGAPLAVVGGMVWGSLLAGIYSVIGGFLGSLVAYFIGRTLGRSAIQALTGRSIYFAQQRGEVYVGWLIFFSRLFPVLPFDLISYGAGITKLPVRIYATATLLGMIPSTFLLSYAGAAIVTAHSSAALLIIFALFIGIPLIVYKYNWFRLRDMIRVESGKS